jgi:nucleoside-diphosphate kinase
MERTLVLVKPDGVQRGLIGEVIGRFERKGLRIAAMKQMSLDRDTAEHHYAEHNDKPFFSELVAFITSGPVVALVVEGPGAVATVRQMMGVTDPAQAAPGTIRGDHGLTIGMNIVHGSDSPERAIVEMDLFFRPEEVTDYRRDVERWILEQPQ